MKRPCLIFNPTARGTRASRLGEKLAPLLPLSALRPTTGPGSARALAAAAVREGFETVVAGGGDGTVNEVINGVGDVPDGFARVALAVLPIGTTNVFAREFRIPFEVEKAWTALANGAELRVDLPQIEWRENGEPKSRYFAQLASAGADAEAVLAVNWTLKKKIGYAAYLVAGFKVLFRHHPVVSVAANGRTVGGEQVIIGNGRFYGGSFPFFPFSDMQDGCLEVVIFPKVTCGALLRCAWGLFRGRVHTTPENICLKAPLLELSSAEPVPMQIDGEPLGYLPASIRVNHRGLRVIVPRPAG